jgi:CRISPR-associated protein Cmr2
MEESEIKRWHEEVLQKALLTEEALGPASQLPGGGLALLSADTDRTQSYVFQSARLPEIRGASMLLDQLNREELLKLLRARYLNTEYINDDSPGCVIFNGGGSLLAIVPVNLADELVSAIEAIYPQATGTAMITVVWQPITVDEARGVLPEMLREEALASLARQLSPAHQARFQGSTGLTQVQRLMRRQTLALRRRKQAKMYVPHFESNPFARLCNSCGRRPATSYFRYEAGEAGRYLCAVCGQNGRRGSSKDKGKGFKTHWHRRFQEQTGIDPGGLPGDLADIGAVSRRYIGFVYTDGNSIGRLLEKVSSLRAFSQLSQQLLQSTEAAVFSALQSYLYDGEKMLPFEIITIGGDDVLLIVPAHTALPVARHICAGFSERMVGIAGPPTMSAGVVLAQESNPIYFLSDLADKLLKSAKRRTQQTKSACLDFMVLKSQSTLATDLRDVRRSSFLQVQHEQNKERCFLTGRPYTLDEVDKLLESTRKLKSINFAPGQLHQMRREFQNGRFPGLFYYLYQRTRLSRLSQQYEKVLAEIEAAWGMAEPKGAAPWRVLPDPGKRGFTEFDTPFLDMLALREFVE